MSDSKPHFSVSWSRLAGELVVIVIGVLLALGADAAWDGRKEQERETVYLQNLLQEMRGARDELSGDHGRRAARIESLELLQKEFNSRTAPDSAVYEWLKAGLDISAYFPPNAVLQDLLTSGDLGLLSSNELRFAISKYSQEQPRLRWMEEQARVLAQDHLRPFLTDRILLTGSQPSASQLEALLSSQKLLNLIDRRRSQLAEVQTFSTRTRDAIESVIELLEADRRAAS